MADKDFLIEEELQQMVVDLNIPSFLNGEAQLSCETKMKSRSIARV